MVKPCGDRVLGDGDQYSDTTQVQGTPAAYTPTTPLRKGSLGIEVARILLVFFSSDIEFSSMALSPEMRSSDRDRKLRENSETEGKFSYIAKKKRDVKGKNKTSQMYFRWYVDKDK